VIGPAYLTGELSHSSDLMSRRRLRSASSRNLIVRRTRLCQQMVIIHFRMLVLVSGIALYLASLLRRQLNFAFKTCLKHFSSLALFLN